MVADAANIACFQYDSCEGLEPHVHSYYSHYGLTISRFQFCWAQHADADPFLLLLLMLLMLLLMPLQHDSCYISRTHAPSPWGPPAVWDNIHRTKCSIHQGGTSTASLRQRTPGDIWGKSSSAMCCVFHHNNSTRAQMLAKGLANAEVEGVVANICALSGTSRHLCSQLISVGSDRNTLGRYAPLYESRAPIQLILSRLFHSISYKKVVQASAQYVLWCLKEGRQWKGKLGQVQQRGKHALLLTRGGEE